MVILILLLINLSFIIPLETSLELNKNNTFNMYNYDNISLFKDGKRWFPIMGEMHYSRYPQEFWRESLLKMKSGGIEVVSSYVIWIHHEEIEGQYDFNDERDLGIFVKICKECGLKLWLRIGPWVHGEVRNGGFPDWLLKKEFEPRTNDEQYFKVVEKWYKKIYEQVKGYFFSEKESQNPIIGVQIENEYGHVGGLSNEEGEIHMSRLIKMAKEIGFIVPFYTATGWGGAITAGLIPVMGGYCDAPWDPRTTEIEPSGNYIFTYERNDHNIGSDHGIGEGTTFNYSDFPYLTAELGGGLQMTKHRRTVASAKDISALSLVKIGSGVNLLGYYMFHGGTNPDGKLTTLQESKETGYPNDVPVKSYDFNAPIREYGQISSTFKELKLLFLFIHNFGSELCYLPAQIPEDNPLKPENFVDLRYSYRTDGKKGYVFINNYVRHQELPVHKNVKIPFPNKDGFFETLTINSGEFFFLPFNMKFGDINIISAECSPLCKLSDGMVVFYSTEFSNKKSGFFKFSEETKSNAVKFLVISRQDALNSWKLKDGRLIITENNIIQDSEGAIYINGRGDCSFLVYPDFQNIPLKFKQTGTKNLNIAEDLPPVIFTSYSSKEKMSSPTPNIIYFAEKKSSKEKKIYKFDISLLVEDYLYKKKSSSLIDCFIQIFYEGESARLYAKYGNKKVLIADNFFSGKEFPWEIGLKRFENKGIDFSNLEIEIFALTSNDDIYFENPNEIKNNYLCNLNSFNVEFEWSHRLNY